MKAFEKLKYSQIKALLEVVDDIKEKNIEIIKKRHNSISENFIGAMEFLLGIKVLTKKNGKISIKKAFQATLNERLTDNVIKRLLLNELLSQKRRISQDILSYLDKFEIFDNTFEYKPNTYSRVKESGVRNLLIELDLIEYNSNTGAYRIKEMYFDSFESYLSNKVLSPQELTLVLKRKEDLGKAAELEVLRYEKERLTKYPELIANIEYTAQKDVLAGYDILSWETEYVNDKLVPRYIEVKAISRNDSGFYWTRNEIKKAQKLNDRYHLYLLPTIGNNQFDIDALEIISDPITKVFNNSNYWNQQVEMYLFSKKHK